MKQREEHEAEKQKNRFFHVLHPLHVFLSKSVHLPAILIVPSQERA
jgi:hypothetical protein